MSDGKMSDIIRTSLEGIKNFTEMENAIGNPIMTESGVTVIPVSKVSIGFATGGVDIGGKKVLSNQNFGGGGGTGVSITPLAFLTINKNAEINLIPIDRGEKTSLDHALSVIEKSPQIIEKIKNALS
jgi:sporulation protein YtfJ